MSATVNSKHPVSFIPSENWIKEHTAVFIGVGSINLSSHKTHALARIFFNESNTEAKVFFTRDQIQHGWLSNVFPDLPLGGFFDWRTDTIFDGKSLEINNLDHVRNITKEFYDKRIESVTRVTITIDSETTYQNSLLEQTIVQACKNQFKNLKGYSLVFSSL